MRRRTVLGLLALAPVVVACGVEPAAEALPRPYPVVPRIPPGVTTLTAANDAFGMAMLTAPELAEHANLVVSPVSVSLALQMIETGAKGRTAQEIVDVLNLPDDADVRALLRALDGQDDLSVANTVWAQQDLRINPDFTDALRDSFDARLGKADFRRDADGARERINKTVADQTHGRITDLFPVGKITEDTRLVLTNALYLNAAWAQEFPAENTSDAPFTRPDGSTVTVPMMRNASAGRTPENLGYASGTGYEAVTLPYKGGKLAFTVLLPTGTSLDELMDVLRTKGIPEVLAAIAPAPVTLAMPKFTMRSGLDLVPMLKAAGMPTAFDSNAADFTGITDESRLFVSTVQHKTFIKVDEHGTEAAAATGIGAVDVSATVSYTVTVDHPFLFVITDTATGAPLFLGRVTDPAAG